MRRVPQSEKRETDGGGASLNGSGGASLNGPGGNEDGNKEAEIKKKLNEK